MSPLNSETIEKISFYSETLTRYQKLIYTNFKKLKSLLVCLNALISGTSTPSRKNMIFALDRIVYVSRKTIYAMIYDQLVRRINENVAKNGIYFYFLRNLFAWAAKAVTQKSFVTELSKKVWNTTYLSFKVASL